MWKLIFAGLVLFSKIVGVCRNIIKKVILPSKNEVKNKKFFIKNKCRKIKTYVMMTC